MSPHQLPRLLSKEEPAALTAALRPTVREVADRIAASTALVDRAYEVAIRDREAIDLPVIALDRRRDNLKYWRERELARLADDAVLAPLRRGLDTVWGNAEVKAQVRRHYVTQGLTWLVAAIGAAVVCLLICTVDTGTPTSLGTYLILTAIPGAVAVSSCVYATRQLWRGLRPFTAWRRHELWLTVVDTAVVLVDPLGLGQSADNATRLRDVEISIREPITPSRPQ